MGILILISMLLISCTITYGGYFRGGTISWEVVQQREVQFYSRLGFDYGKGPGCDNNNIGKFVTNLGSDHWQCISGCATLENITDVNYFCAASKIGENWEQGDRNFNHVFATDGPFIVSYTGKTLMPLNYSSASDFHLQTRIDLRVRSDTNKPNSSPVTASEPVYHVPFGCKTAVNIPVTDPDGDNVLCRWAKGVECGSVCRGIPNASTSLNSQTCTLIIDTSAANGFVAGGFYAVTLTIEDFSKVPISLNGIVISRNTSLSSIPLQFMIHTENLNQPCNTRPVFVNPTYKDQQVIHIPKGDNLLLRVYAESKSPMSRISEFLVSPPAGLRLLPSISDDYGRQNVWYADMIWTPPTASTGTRIVCVETKDSNGMHSNQRCFFLKYGLDHPCLKTPCNHNGNCTLHLDSFKCNCDPAFTGKTCDIEMDECLSNPCHNGGTCLDNIGGYHCYCRDGFKGVNCQDIDECASIPCLNFGTCLGLPSSYNCTCTLGYKGHNCSSEIDECSSNPCRNGGQCKDLVGDYLCLCSSGYKGKNCDEKVNFCNPNPCENNGICTSFSDSYSCSCGDHFMGLNCELSQNEVCNEIGESYCSCEVNGKRIKLPLSKHAIEPTTSHDLVAGLVGFPIGVLIGVGICLIWYYMIKRLCSTSYKRFGTKPNMRPSSTESSNRLFSRSISPVSSSDVRISSPVPGNIYRSAFNDDGLHKSGIKMNDHTYLDGKADWM